MGVATAAEGHIPQKMRALDKANRIRLDRAEVRKEVRSLPQTEGRLKVAAVIEDPPECTARMEIGDLVGEIRRWGSTRTRKFLGRFNIAETKHIGSLTERQRRVVAQALRAGT